jgi:hypothetical protein
MPDRVPAAVLPAQEKIVISKSGTMHYTGPGAFKSGLAGVNRIPTYCGYHIKHDEQMNDGEGRVVCEWCVKIKRELEAR